MRAACLTCLVGVVVSTRVLLGVPPDPHYKLVLQAPPATAVNSVAVSPDGSLVATAAGEGGVRLYEARTGALLRVVDGVGDRGVAFSPDGRTLTAAGFHMDKLVGLWDVRSGDRVRTFAGQTEWEADATAISPDGKLLASTATDRQILVWEVATGKLRLRLKDQPSRVSALAFSPDGSVLAAGGGDRSVRLFDCATGRLRRSLEGQGDWVCTLAFSPDGERIASGSCDWGFHRGHDWPRPVERGPEQCEWRLWEVRSGKLERKVTESGRMLSLAVAPDGKSLACGIGREVRLYELSSDAPARAVTSHDGDVTSVAFTPDGAAVVSGSHDQTVRFTRLASGEVAWRAPGYFEQVNSVALSADGSLLATGSSDHRFARERVPAGAKHAGPGAVRLWDARTGRMLRRLGDPADQVMAVALSPDGGCLAAGGGTGEGKGSVHVWEVATGAPLWSANDHAKATLAVAFAPDGSAVAAAAADGVVRVYPAASGTAVHTLEGHRGGATAVAFAPDGNTLFCGEAHGGTRVWDVRTGRLLRTCDAPRPRAESFTVDRLMNSIGLTADGATLATCASSVNNEFVGAVRTWDARTGVLLRDFTAEKIHGRPMALSPDGSLVATGGKSVKLWDVKSGRLVRELYGHLKRTQSITFSADGRLIVSGGSYGTTNVWEVASGRHLVTLFTFCDAPTGSATDDWLAYHPDGYYKGSPGVERSLAWRVGDTFRPAEVLAPQLHRPDRVTAALKPTSVQPSRCPECGTMAPAPPAG
jgi:WD40 repeat protein